MTEIIVAREKGCIYDAIEVDDGVERYLRVQRILSDGTKYYDLPMQKVPKIGPIFRADNAGGRGDIDDIALRDLWQLSKANPPPPRENKPDITQMYFDLQEARRIEMGGRRHHGMWSRKKVR